MIEVKKDHFFCSFKNFPQYKAYSTAMGDYVFTMVYPSNTDICIDLFNVKEGLGFERSRASVYSYEVRSNDE